MLASYILFTYATFIPSWQSQEEALPFDPIKGHQRQGEGEGLEEEEKKEKKGWPIENRTEEEVSKN